MADEITRQDLMAAIHKLDNNQVKMATQLDHIAKVQDEHGKELSNLNDVDKKIASFGLHRGTEAKTRAALLIGRAVCDWRVLATILSTFAALAAYWVKTHTLPF